VNAIEPHVGRLGTLRAVQGFQLALYTLRLHSELCSKTGDGLGQPPVFPVRPRIVAKTLPTGFVVLTRFQCPAGKSWKAISPSRPSHTARRIRQRL